MTAKAGTVYVLVDPRCGEVRYVGATTRPLRTRLAGHRSSPSPRVRPWIHELAEEGMVPEIRPVVEGVSTEELPIVEREQIIAHHEAGCVLLNVDDLPLRRLDTIRECEAFVERCRPLGAVALAVAEDHLARTRERLEQERRWTAEMREMQQRLYPDDPAKQREAILRYARADGPESMEQLPPEGWELLCAEVMAVAAALRPHGYSFQDVVLGRFFDGVFYNVRTRMEQRSWERPVRDVAA